MENRCKIISVISQKGGVGKSATATQLAVGLVRKKHKVLFIDADPQGTGSMMLGVSEPDEIEESIATVLTKIINEKPVSDSEAILHTEEGVDLLPANIDLASMEVTLVNTMNREQVLKQYVALEQDWVPSQPGTSLYLRPFMFGNDAFLGVHTVNNCTFLIIAFTVFARMSVSSANAQAKVINLTSNITSLVVFLLNGQVVFLLGLAGALCNMAGNWLGSGLALNKGTRIVRPVILGVLLLLFLKIIIGF